MCPLRYLWLLFMGVLAHAQEQDYQKEASEPITIEPVRPKPIYIDEVTHIEVGLNGTDLRENDMVQIRVQLREDWLTRAVLLNTTLNLTADDPAQNFSVRGLFIGYAYADVSYCSESVCTDEDFRKSNRTVRFIVSRRQRTVDTLFTVLILCLVVTANLGMGCSVDVGVVKEVLRRPVAPVIGFLCQFCIMPPVSFMLGQLFNLTVAEQLGLLAVGSSPGGGASNMWTVLFNGDVSLSITMTLISTLASLGMFPLWLFTLGRVVTKEATFTIPFQNILGSLVGTIVPVGIGILIQRKRPAIAKKIAKITKPMLFIFLLFILTFGIWVNLFMFRLFHILLLGASMCLPYIGYIGGGLVAWLCKQPKSRIIAICLETGIQNVGVAIFALRLSLPQPENDLSIVASVCPSIFTSVPLIVSFLCLTVHERCAKKPPEVEMVKCNGHDAADVEEARPMTEKNDENHLQNGVN